MDKIQYEGLWWLPIEVEQGRDNLIAPAIDMQIFGRLMYSPEEGSTLNLISSFQKLERDRILAQTGRYASTARAKRYPIILCRTNDDTFITLHDCIQTSHKESLFSGIPAAIVDARIAFINNDRFLGLGDMQFRKVEVEYSYLNGWLDLDWFNSTKEVDMQYCPENFEEQIAEGVRISLKYKLDQEGDGFHELQYHQKVSLVLEADMPLELNEGWSKYLDLLRYILNLATDRANSELEVFVYPDDASRTQVLQQMRHYEQGEARLTDDSCFFRLQHLVGELGTGNVSSDSENSWLEFSHALGELINRWLKLNSNSELFAISQRFIEVMYMMKSSEEQRFTSIVLIANAYGNYKLKEFVEVKAEVNPEDPNLILDRTHLVTNFDILISNVGPAITPLLVPYETEGVFVERVVNLMQCYTNYSLICQDEPAPIHEIYFLNHLIGFIIKLQLLRDMGISMDLCKQLVSENGRISTLKQIAEQMKSEREKRALHHQSMAR